MHSNAYLRPSHPTLITQSSLAAALGPEGVSAIQPGFEPLRKKDGSLSKIRSHRGNIPVLPQTKLCPHCPAKFTRTTHLNRHLRNHTNERFHRCDMCDSQFTRSDLLTRHKKSCNNPSSRSRKRSCIACMDSKIKCDRQVPCAKCVSKGSECIYGPATRKALASTATAATLTTPIDSSPNHDAQDSLISPSSDITPTSHPSRSRTVSSSQPDSPSDTPPTSSSSASAPTPPMQTSGLVYVRDPKVYRRGPQIPGLAMETSVPSLVPALRQDFSSPALYTGVYGPERVIETYPPPKSDITPTDDRLVPISSHLSSAYGSDVFTPFFTTIFPQTSPTSTLNEVTLTIEELSVRGDSPEDFPFGRLLEESSSPSSQNSTFSVENLKADPYQSFEVDKAQGLFRVASPEATQGELQYYLHIFFTTFLTQIPIVHAPTFRAEKKSPVLLSAMQACGALFVGNKRATEFISKTLASARETLVHDFAKKSTDLLDQVQLILAVVLLQTIGLFHQQSDQRASSSIYHGMLVMMIRQTGLIPYNASWTPPSINDGTLESAWFDWARHEMAKRAILWSFMHDCCHCIYFALPSSYHAQEVTLNLPCESALWQASTATEWYMVIQRSSPYGTTQASRLTGMSIPKMLAYLTETRTIPTTVPLSAIAHFALLHIILKQLFQYIAGGKPPKSKEATGDGDMDPEMFRLQFSLHNWLQNWKNSPDSRVEAGSGEPPFIQNLLPFYWLGQVAMLAYQENLPPFEYNSPNNLKVEARFRVVKRWLRHIRSFLRSHDDDPTLYWDELMKLRLQSPHHQGPEAEDRDEGLLEFFPEAV